MDKWLPYKGCRLTDGKGNDIDVQKETGGFYRASEVDAILTAEPEPCEDARFAKVARLIVARCLGSLEANPTYIEAVHTLLVQHFASQVADKRTEELRAQMEVLRRALEKISGSPVRSIIQDPYPCGNRACRMVQIASEALAATEPKPPKESI